MPISNEFLTQLGLITLNFENYQKHLEFLIWALIGEDQILGQMITCKMSFKNICELASSLFQYRCDNEDLRKLLDSIISKSLGMEDKRNTIIHSAYADSGDPKLPLTRIKFTARKGKDFKQAIEDIKGDDLKPINTELVTLQRELAKFTDQIAQAGIINLHDRLVQTPDVYRAKKS
jgi:hypothetical protein